MQSMNEHNKNPRNNLGNQKQYNVKGQQRSNTRANQIIDIPPYLKALFDELAPAIANFLNKTAESQARIAVSNEKRAEAVAKLVDTLPDIIQQTIPTRKEPRRRKIPPQKQETLDLINKLRNEDNMTLEQVADYLTKNNIPTFSGRGRWHAQTIHRLCMYHPF